MAQLRLAMDDSTRVGEARRQAVRLAVLGGCNPVEQGRVAIVATELATNLLRYAKKGEILLQLLDPKGPTVVEILAIDAGPGSSDGGISWMRDGYSSGGTAGTGLGAVKRQSDTFDIYSVMGRGTVVVSRIRASGLGEGVAHLTLGAVCLPLATETACGDGWSCVQGSPMSSLLVVDGLGHGPDAAIVAELAIATFEASPFDPPVGLLEAIHTRLSGTRGGAVAVAQLSQGELRYAGVGNISGTLRDPGGSKGLLSHNGTAGVVIRRMQEVVFPLPPRFTLIMHSDGLTSRWQQESWPGMWECHPSVCASALYRGFRRERDDVTVLIARAAA